MILYFDCPTKTVSSIQPSTEGKQVVAITWPATLDMPAIMTWLGAINDLCDRGLPMVFALTIADS